jgi:hypothetical protein
MFSAKALTALATATAVAVLPFAVHAQEVAPVKVEARAPTTIQVRIVGKDVAQVRQDVHAAATTVCKNAVENRELSLFDRDWCDDETEAHAMRHYATIVRHSHGLLAQTEITLAVR